MMICEKELTAKQIVQRFGKPRKLKSHGKSPAQRALADIQALEKALRKVKEKKW